MSEREQLADVGCGCDEAPECTHTLYWLMGYRAAQAASPAAPSGKLAELRDAANWMWQQSARKDIGPSRREAFELSAVIMHLTQNS